MNLMIVNQQGGNNTLLRDYRKGNWTLQETMVLIEAKKMDDERRMKRLGDMSERTKPAELRWKWVEDYCWKNGCLRSQNQCNDKWDNLMRDFKKVREYQSRVVGHEEEKSYWRIEKSERKDNHLPSNMLPQIYEALMDVMERKSGRGVVIGGGVGSTSGNVEIDVGDKSASGGGSGLLGHLSMPMSVFGQQQQQQQQQQQNTIVRSPPVVVLPISPPVETTPEQANIPFAQQLPSVDSDTSEYSDSPAKRRKKGGEGGGSGERTSGGGGANTLQEVGTAISKSAAIIAEALQSSEERDERRHREILSLHERRLQIEESKAEINRQGINGLVDAVNKLANSILALAGNNNQTASK